MNFFEKILKVLDAEMTEPTMYSWFHIMWLVIVVALCVTVCLLSSKLTAKRTDRIVFITGLVMIALEIYKQFNFSYTYTTDIWDYQWYAFPFQFCSTPMYIMLLAAVIRNEKVRQYLYSYLATFSLFAGIAVMLFPSTVFVDTIGINIQTMVHHGAMVVIGVLMYSSKRLEISNFTIFKAMTVFAVTITMATVGNVLFEAFGNGETFNMFYISKTHGCELPLLSTISENAPYIVFLMTYVLGFSIVSFIVLTISSLLAKKIFEARSKLKA
ncbi:MAG: YwaF family protein [Clostridia bacterium]|nr:YwaF family protein [Clostridia bacterium]